MKSPIHPYVFCAMALLAAEPSILARLDQPRAAHSAGPVSGPRHPPEGISQEGWQSILRQIAGTVAGCDWNEFATPVAADAAPSDLFGASVSISGDTIVVGADQAVAPFSNPGSAYVFERNAGGADNWAQVKKLTAGDAGAGDSFGGSVSIAGDTIVVGARGDDAPLSNSGSAYVFERDAGGADNWGQVKKLTAGDAGASDFFGGAVSIHGDRIVVGAEQDDAPLSNCGSAYVFERNTGGADNWGQLKKLTAGDAAANDFFGSSVSIGEDTIVVGAYFDDAPLFNSGSAYVFARNAGGADNWGQVKKLTAGDAAASDEFGGSVSISEGTIVVGARRDSAPLAASGSAYVFERNAGGADNWGQLKKLTAGDAAEFDEFGFPVSISGDTIVVGARVDDAPLTNSGSAYLFARNQGGAENWGQVKKLTDADAAEDDLFGRSVSISEDRIVVGAYLDDAPLSNSGSAHVFGFNCPVCGDGLREPGEGCDDGPGNSDVIPDACRTDCTPAGCGDEVIDTGEACDDAGESASCDADCTPAVCGDGRRNVPAGEACDDAGETASCDADCTLVACGDGTRNLSAGESCDDAGPSASCDADCTLPVCGDTTWNPLAGEACDDGDTVGGDGCAADCGAGCASSDIDKIVNGAALDGFGYSVSMSGDTLVIGAPLDDEDPINSGWAYVFERNAGGADSWGQVKRLTPAGVENNDQFGISVSISGDTIVVGAYGDDTPSLSDSGAAYVFARNQGGAGNWGQVKKLTAGDAATADLFGVSVSNSGDTIVVGASGDDAPTFSDSGSAYVFARNQGGANNWGQVKKLTAADAFGGDVFGVSVSISEDTIVVGAYGDAFASGSGYVFARNAGGADNWGQVKKLTAGDAAPDDNFGFSVSIGADTIVVGARGDSVPLAASGSAYVFARNAGGADNWGQVKKLTAADATGGDFFGASVSISGDSIVVGAYSDEAPISDSGSAYVFTRNAGGADNWGQVKKLTAINAAAPDRFGVSVSISGDTTVVGAHVDDAPPSESGAAYVFDLTCPGGPGEGGPAGSLRASRNGASLDVTFEPACGATDHAAYFGFGPIVGSAQWNGGACGLGTGEAATFDPGVVLPGQFTYFVIVGYDGDDEGSYGRRSNMIERPEAVGVAACDRPLGAATCP